MNATKTQHTPGPWEVDRQDDSEHGARVLVITQQEKVAVAALWEENVDALDALMPDARLIAAAPEMLELLGVLTDSEHTVMCRNQGGCPAIEKARALLARIARR